MRRLGDERLDRRGERVVGVVDEHVALAQHGEELVGVVRRVGEARGRHRRPRLGVEVGAIERVHAPQPAQVERRGDAEDALAADLELGGQQLDDVVVHVGFDLEAQGLAEAASSELHFDGDEEVVGLVLLEGQVGVAGDPEGVVVPDRHAGEERVEVGGDDLLERHEALAVGHDDEAGQRGRDLDPGDAALVRRRVLDLDDEVEREVGDVGERVPRVDGEGGEDGVDLAVEDLDEVVLVVVIERGPVREADAGGREGGDDQVQEDVVLRREELFDPAPDHGQLLAGSEAVDRAGAHAGGDLVL